jgi:hypothetical protein
MWVGVRPRTSFAYRGASIVSTSTWSDSLPVKVGNVINHRPPATTVRKHDDMEIALLMHFRIFRHSETCEKHVKNRCS